MRYDPETGERFVPQLIAAIDRHEEAQNWCTWDNVVAAALAVSGDPVAQANLAESPAWRLTDDGLLPVTGDESEAA